MTYRFFLVFLVSASIAFAVGYLLTYPLRYTITFSVVGNNGDETISLSKNWGMQPILQKIAVGKDFRQYSLTTWLPVFNLRLNCNNLNSETPPRQTTVLFGVIKVSRWNILGNLVDETDWLNIGSEYHSSDGHTYDIDSSVMSTIRSGITGWEGYYMLRAP